MRGDTVTFGPVPSRRLGQSLGINNIPPKICSYACVYCQLGRTLTMQIERTDFYDPERIFEEVRKRVEEVRVTGESVDYLSFVPARAPPPPITNSCSISSRHDSTLRFSACRVAATL
jgi:wyosine [tRNA(Phe)-imidazoG37] synthetase (radical SAM superfamily)